MEMMSDYYYTILDGTILSVTAKTSLDTNLFSMSGGGIVYQLGIDGKVVDSHEHKTMPKAGSMFAILEQGNRKISIRVDVSPGMFKVRYTMLIDDSEVTLKKTSESELKALWHKKNITGSI